MKTVFIRLNHIVFASALLSAFLVVTDAQDLCRPVGWATQNGGVSGGGSVSPTVVSNYDDFKSALVGSAKVVHVNGTITIPAGGRVTIQDQVDKTIIGLSGSKMVSADMSKEGSGIMYIKRCKNFIMRNLEFEGPGAYDIDGYDNLCIDNCQNFWVDHCEFHDGVDGNFDIKNMSDFISVTWCTFSYEKPPISGGSGGSNDHRYSNLIGSSDNATDDEGHLNVTFHYCWWGEGCRERMPRMRYGKLHMVNNLFSSTVSNNCIRAGYKADILAVGNYFDDQKLPVDEFDGDYTAIRAYNNYGAGDITKGTAFTPPYSIDVANSSTIVNPIKSCAGAKLSGTDGCSACGESANKQPTVTLTAPENNANFDAPATFTISATAIDDDGTISTVEFYNGTTLLGSDNSSPYSYSWDNVAAGSYTISAKATDNNGATGTSSPVTITVTDPSLPSLSATPNITQAVDSGEAVSPIVFTWGGAATDVTHTSLPDGLTALKNASAKTLTVSGTPVSECTFTVSTVGGTPEVTMTVSISLKEPSRVLADWYPFQEDPVSLDFVSFDNASVVPDFYDQEKPDHGVPYSPGALRLDKSNGTMTLALHSLAVLKIRWYATGERTLKVTYGPEGTENTWSSSPFESGAHESDFTGMISELVSETPVTVRIINDRVDGGTLNIHDLYVEGTEPPISGTWKSNVKAVREEAIACRVAGNRLFIYNNNTPLRYSSRPAIIMNLQGRTVAMQNSSPVIDISQLRTGVYLLKIGELSRKFIRN